MNVDVQTAATETKLVTTTMLRTRLGVSSSFDAVLGELIDEATDAIEDYLGRPLAYQVYTEKVSGADDEYLLLSRMPLVSITSVLKDTGTTVSSTAYSIYDPEAGLVFNSTGWEWDPRYRGEIAFDPVPGSEDLNYTVTYGAGYALPSVTTITSSALPSTAHSLPASLRRAALITAAEWFGALNLNVTATQFRRVQAEDLEIEYEGGSAAGAGVSEAIPNSALNLLRPYVRDLR